MKNGMMMGKALTLCPDLKVLPYDFNGYSEVSTILYETVARLAIVPGSTLITYSSTTNHFLVCCSLLHQLNAGL